MVVVANTAATAVAVMTVRHDLVSHLDSSSSSTSARAYLFVFLARAERVLS